MLNQPLDPHQFDHRGLGMVDGELILDHVKRVVYVLKNGVPVKLADFQMPRRDDDDGQTHSPERPFDPAASPRRKCAAGRGASRLATLEDDRPVDDPRG